MASSTGTSAPLKSNNFAPSEETVAMLKERARFIRLETVRLIEIAKTGHYTSVFSAAEIFAALYYDVMRLRRGEPGWAARNRFTIGKGHPAQRVAETVTTEQVAEFEALNDSFTEAAAKDPELASRINRNFHFRILKLAGMPYIESICESMWTLMGSFLRTFHEEIPVRQLTGRNPQALQLHRRPEGARSAGGKACHAGGCSLEL